MNQILFGSGYMVSKYYLACIENKKAQAVAQAFRLVVVILLQVHAE
jgi:uncharacterized membrane protein